MNSFVFILNNNLYNIQKELFESNTDFFIRIDFIKNKLSNKSNNLSIIMEKKKTSKFSNSLLIMINKIQYPQ